MTTPPHAKDGLVPLFTAAEIQRRVDQLAETLDATLPHGDILCIAVLHGSFVFVADLARALSVRERHLAIDFMSVGSYGGTTTSSGHVTLRQDTTLPVAGRHVLLVDDILDTGRTLSAVTRMLRERGAASLLTCVLLDKPSRREIPVRADVVGFTVGDVFVVGYGLDYNQRYRNLPYLAALPADSLTRQEG